MARRECEGGRGCEHFVVAETTARSVDEAGKRVAVIGLCYEHARIAEQSDGCELVWLRDRVLTDDAYTTDDAASFGFCREMGERR